MLDIPGKSRPGGAVFRFFKKEEGKR